MPGKYLEEREGKCEKRAGESQKLVFSRYTFPFSKPLIPTPTVIILTVHRSRRKIEKIELAF